jgi:hypothetical protein
VLDAHFFAGHGHRHGLLLGDDLLAEAGLAGGDRLGADTQLSSERVVAATSLRSALRIRPLSTA